MKITLVDTKKEWVYEQLRSAAEKYGVELEVMDIHDLNDVPRLVAQAGQAVIWRGTSMNNLVNKTAVLEAMKDRVLLNPGFLRFPFISYKYFQQKFLEGNTDITYIPTYTFQNKQELVSAVENNILSYPFIAKPNYGARGENIHLIHNQDEMEAITQNIEHYVIQNFIRNTGDYRVLVLGGKMIGAIKRVAQSGQFLNNVSQGGSVYWEKDPRVLKQLQTLALKIASVFDLAFCGVDVIRNEDDGNYYMMEVNSIPQFKGFQSAAPVNVAEELIKYCIAMAARKEEPAAALVERYYQDNLDFIDQSDAFHFVSRLSLWTGQPVDPARKQAMEAFHTGTTDEETLQKLKELACKNFQEITMLYKPLREPYFRQYPELYPYCSILFRVLMADQLFSKDLRPLVASIITDEQLHTLKDRVFTDTKALPLLSSHSINFFYLYDHYFGTEIFDPQFILDNYQQYHSERLKQYPELLLYLLTHCIIGESRFYSRPVAKHTDAYKTMVKHIEEIIRHNYYRLSLDAKLEYVLCLRLLDMHRDLEVMIMQEAERSLSPIGNYIVDTLNDRRNPLRDSLTNAEHRNVLFLMASRDFIGNQKR